MRAGARPVVGGKAASSHTLHDHCPWGDSLPYGEAMWRRLNCLDRHDLQLIWCYAAKASHDDLAIADFSYGHAPSRPRAVRKTLPARLRHRVDDQANVPYGAREAPGMRDYLSSGMLAVCLCDITG